jgi:hypothetical protein
MLSGRLNYRCQVFPGTVSRTLYAGVADTQRRRGGGVSWPEVREFTLPEEGDQVLPLAGSLQRFKLVHRAESS